MRTASAIPPELWPLSHIALCRDGFYLPVLFQELWAWIFISNWGILAEEGKISLCVVGLGFHFVIFIFSFRG